MTDIACAPLPRSTHDLRSLRHASALLLIFGMGSLVGCGGNAMTGSGGAGNTNQAGTSNAGGDSNGGSGTGNGNGGNAPAGGGDAVGGAGGAGAETPAEQRAAAACGAAIEATNDYREGFCAFAAALDAGDAAAESTDAGAQASPEAACEACLTGNDASQNAALESCTEAAVGCDGLTVDEVENCLTAAGDTLDSRLPTCDEATDPETVGGIFTLLLALSTHEECSEFLSCAAILESLTGQ